MRKTIGVLSALCLAGCASIPNSGEFDDKNYTTVVGHPGMVLMNAGVVENERIYKDGKEVGYRIVKKHWAAGELGCQEIYYPEGAENVAVSLSAGIRGIRTNRTYDFEGNRFLEETVFGKFGKKMKSNKSFRLELERGKWVKKERVDNPRSQIHQVKKENC